MKVIVTGAHFTPAQAVVEELIKYQDISVTYIGRNHTREGDRSMSVESQVFPKLGVKFYSLVAGRLSLVFSPYTFLSLLKIPIGFIQAFLILIIEQPDLVVSFGGYIGLPVVVSAWLLSVPVILHEQTLVTGVSNKISSYFADKIAISFDYKNSFNKDKVILTGNPIRKELLINPAKPSKDFVFLAKVKDPIILITCGNQGSHIINQMVEKSVEELTKNAVVIHQTGDSKFKDFERLSQQQTDRYKTFKWIDAFDMGYLYKNADLVISRAGANTLMELAYFGVPTLMIPIPFATHDEQSVNAKYFQRNGLGEVLNQETMTPGVFLDKVNSMLKIGSELKKDASGAKKAVVADGAKKLTQEILLSLNA